MSRVQVPSPALVAAAWGQELESLEEEPPPELPAWLPPLVEPELPEEPRRAVPPERARPELEPEVDERLLEEAERDEPLRDEDFLRVAPVVDPRLEPVPLERPPVDPPREPRPEDDEVPREDERPAEPEPPLREPLPPELERVPPEREEPERDEPEPEEEARRPPDPERELPEPERELPDEEREPRPPDEPLVLLPAIAVSPDELGRGRPPAPVPRAPPSCLLTVAQAMRSALLRGAPRDW